MTLSDLKRRLALYHKAEETVLTAHQSYTISGTTYNRANLGQLQSEINRLEIQIASAEGNFKAQPIVFAGRR